MLFYTAVALALCFVLSSCDNDMDPLSDEFINFINANQNSWRAGRNFHKDTPIQYLRNVMGTFQDDMSNDTDVVFYEPDPDIALPKTFDARIQWPYCSSLNDIRDQGSCESCWAVATASCITDRVCINRKQNFYFSETDMLICCKDCGFGCDGGKLKEAWKYYKNTGVVSGGPYKSKQGCQPYLVEPCDHYNQRNEIREKCNEKVMTPACITECIETTYSTNYFKDKQKGSAVYKFKNVKAAKVNLMKNGPITSTFKVFSDFFNYKEGVYKHVAGKHEGDHSVKIIGWGEENGELYWLIAANSFNTGWGDKGFFKFLRGVNHCGIEENIVAGI